MAAAPAGLDLDARMGPNGARVWIWMRSGPLLRDSVIPF
jgi:hypothetical protein